MTLLSLLGRIMRYFLLRPETLFLLCISLALWSYFFHTDEVKTIVKSSRDAVKMVKGKVAEIMQNDRLGGLDVLEAEFSKTWEFKSHNVAVYSIQGRRDHMEDRFEVLTDLANKTHPSIFGIFDGHGGEVGVLRVCVRGGVGFGQEGRGGDPGGDRCASGGQDPAKPRRSWVGAHREVCAGYSVRVCYKVPKVRSK